MGASPLQVIMVVGFFALIAAPLSQSVAGPYVLAAGAVWGVYFSVARLQPWGRHNNGDAKRASLLGAVALSVIALAAGHEEMASRLEWNCFGPSRFVVPVDVKVLCAFAALAGLAVSILAFRKGFLGLRWSILDRQGRVDAWLGMLCAACYWGLFLFNLFVPVTIWP